MQVASANGWTSMWPHLQHAWDTDGIVILVVWKRSTLMSWSSYPKVAPVVAHE